MFAIINLCAKSQTLLSELKALPKSAYWQRRTLAFQGAVFRKDGAKGGKWKRIG